MMARPLWSAIDARVPRSELVLATDTVHRLAWQPDAQDGQDAAFREELVTLILAVVGLL